MHSGIKNGEKGGAVNHKNKTVRCPKAVKVGEFFQLMDSQRVTRSVTMTLDDYDNYGENPARPSVNS